MKIALNLLLAFGLPAVLLLGGGFFYAKHEGATPSEHDLNIAWCVLGPIEYKLPSEEFSHKEVIAEKRGAKLMVFYNEWDRSWQLYIIGSDPDDSLLVWDEEEDPPLDGEWQSIYERKWCERRWYRQKVDAMQEEVNEKMREEYRDRMLKYFDETSL